MKSVKEQIRTTHKHIYKSSKHSVTSLRKTHEMPIPASVHHIPSNTSGTRIWAGSGPSNWIIKVSSEQKVYLQPIINFWEVQTLLSSLPSSTHRCARSFNTPSPWRCVYEYLPNAVNVSKLNSPFFPTIWFNVKLQSKICHSWGHCFHKNGL